MRQVTVLFNDLATFERAQEALPRLGLSLLDMCQEEKMIRGLWGEDGEKALAQEAEIGVIGCNLSVSDASYTSLHWETLLSGELLKRTRRRISRWRRW